MRSSEREVKMCMAVSLAAVCLGLLAPRVRATVEDDEVNCAPRHVHLAYGQAADQIVVMWATRKASCNTEVMYGTDAWALEFKVTGASQRYTDHNQRGLHYLHRAVLTGLKENTYYYRPMSNKISAGPFYFKAPKASTDWSPDLLVVGDLGDHMELLPVLAGEALKGKYNAMLQLGGLSPYFADANGTTADKLMMGLGESAAFMPLMTSTGKNETAEGQFPAYRHRFSMPGSMWPVPNNRLWYSFNLGPVHFISYSTDVYFHGNEMMQTAQYDWLVKDLSEANTARDKRPWIIAFGHHPMYCTCDQQTEGKAKEEGKVKDGGVNKVREVKADEVAKDKEVKDGKDVSDCEKAQSLVRTGLENTLYYYGVDLVLQSHTHGYERFYPIFKGVVLANNYTNPRAPVQIVTGKASDLVWRPEATKPGASPAATVPNSKTNSTTTTTNTNTNSSSSVEGKPSGINVTKPATGDADQPLHKSAFRMINATRLAYGRLLILNATHLQWELISGSAVAEKGVKLGDVLDSFMMVQEHHGKFQLTDLPQEVEEKIDQNLVRTDADGGVANGGKPGVLNVHDPEVDTKNMLEADDNRRLIIGSSFGGLILLIGFIVMVYKLKKRSRRRVARRWDSMDYKYGKTKLYTPTDDEVDEDDEFRDDNDFEMDLPDGSQPTSKLINGKK